MDLLSSVYLTISVFFVITCACSHELCSKRAITEMATILCLVKLLAVLSYTTANRPTRQESDITYKTFHVESSIVSRYAITTVTSVVVNGAEESKELDFRVQLPDTAFISNFSM